MTEHINAEKLTKWNVGFFVRRLPPTRWIRGPNICVFRLPDHARMILRKIAHEHREIFEYAWRSLEPDISLVVIRISAPDEPDAAESSASRGALHRRIKPRSGRTATNRENTHHSPFGTSRCWVPRF
jgi:hypothetical protein